MTKPTKYERFMVFHTANPHVYDELHRLALFVKTKGYPRFGIRPLWERLRWRNTFEVDTDEPYKLNDHFKELYARLLMRNEPELEGFFTVRQSQADAAIEAHVNKTP